MSIHLYLSLVPEALIASMLPPEEFGAYYAVGTMKKARGQAMFVEIDPDFRCRALSIKEGVQRCTPHANGDPKCSVYISVYRAAEHIPISALGTLYLTTSDGRTAALQQAALPTSDSNDKLHLYQELCPTRPMVASTKNPLAFFKHMTQPSGALFTLPTLYFADLKLGALADNPEQGDSGDLPYENIDHLRQCLKDIQEKNAPTKMVDRNHSIVFPYRVVKTGFYFGQGKELVYYPMLTEADLLGKYYAWWRSAQM